MAMRIDDQGNIDGVGGCPSLKLIGRLRWENGEVKHEGARVSAMHYKAYWAKTSNSHSQRIGRAEHLPGSPYFFADGDTYHYFPERFFLMELNELGQAVGYDITLPDSAFIWQDGQFTYLPSLPGDREYTHAFGINDHGQVVGMSHHAEGYPTAVLWDNGTVQALGRLGSHNYHTYAVDINNAGEIVGYSNDGKSEFFTGTAPLLWVPEPATLALLAAGGMALLRRRRSRAPG